jgi:hypothetical protein
MRRVRMTVMLCLGVLAVLVPGAGQAAAAVAVTGTAANVTTTTALLQGTINAPSADCGYAFQYGKTNAYGSFTAVSVAGTGTTQVSAQLTKLDPNTTYHFRLVVEDASVDPAVFFVGSDVPFTTSALAGTVAITGNATSIKQRSAMLHGVADPAGPAQWAFQYGTSVSYGHTTTAQKINGGLSAVAVTLGGLQPDTTYHYRLLVVQPSSAYPYYAFSAGADRTFHTRKANPVFGTTRLLGTRLSVRHGRAAIRLKCAGVAAARCHGRISLSARGANRRTVGCGSATFTATGGRIRTLRPRIGSRCAALLRAAPSHRHAVTLKGRFTTHQKPLKRSVTLRG